MPAEAAAPEPADTARAALALWRMACASCHGADGQGAGPALPPGAQVPSFGDPAFHDARTDAQLADAIRNGRNLMPAFGKQLPQDAISALVAHVRGLRR